MALQDGVTVFNASTLNVYAMVVADTVISNQSTVGGAGKFGPIAAEISAGSSASFQSTIKKGYTLVRGLSAVLFYPEITKRNAFVSIKCADVDENDYNHLCEDFSVPSTKSGVIITRDFYLATAKRQWIDIDNRSHKPERGERFYCTTDHLDHLKINKKSQ